MTVIPTQTSQKPDLLTRVNPYTLEALADLEVTPLSRVPSMLESARNAAAQWKNSPLLIRQRLLTSLAEKIRCNALYWAELISRENGKSVDDALASDVYVAVSVLSYYAKYGPQWLKPKTLPFSKAWLVGRISTRVQEPKGVIGIISPWNFPLGTPMSSIAPALMAGNGVILKPSEFTSETAQQLVRFIQEEVSRLGHPPELIQAIIGPGTHGQALCEAGPDHVVFTGSTQTGLSVAKTMAHHGKGVTLEMGGHDAMWILPNPGISMDLITSYALWGRFNNAGQTCAAVKRVVLPTHQETSFIEIILSKLPKLPVQPLIRAEHREKLHALVQDAIDRGAKLWTGGYIPEVTPETPGYFYPATILSNIPDSARIRREEPFGPVLSIYPYDTVEDGLALVNETVYGLTASVFGNEQEALRWASEIDCTQVAINDVAPALYSMMHLPWGGHKASGLGLSHAREGLISLTQTVMITRNVVIGIPGFEKPPWFFDKLPDHGAKNKWPLQMLASFASESWLQKLDPRFTWALLQRLANTRL
ncbi:MAG: aldehyde dehydrogenase family protein [Cyanobacteria bacterium]|nr:aldehyde dehydrogenase family protein [Cyanobacteriota bacterium]